jgi:two-component SAPR family response regulator
VQQRRSEICQTVRSVSKGMLVMLQYQYEDRRLSITTLGRFRVVLGGRVLSEESTRTSKVWELFRYLVANRDRDIPGDILIENLWEEAELENPRRALRNLVYRLRQVLNSEDDPKHSYITLSRGFYRFNTSADYWLDTEEFEQLSAQARNLSGTGSLESAELYKRCLSLYKGEYLPGQMYADWVQPIRNYYRRLFLETFSDYVAYLREHDDLPGIGTICEQVLQVEPLEESIHIEFIDFLLQTGKTKEAQAHYACASSRIYREMGVNPSPDMLKAYKRITMQAEWLDGLAGQASSRNQLGQQKLDGPHSYTPDMFRDMCQSEKQRQDSTGTSLFVVGLRLKPDDSVEKFGIVLSNILKETLREGDAFCHWKPHEFLLLLPISGHDKVEKVIKRISELYGRQCDAKRPMLETWYEPLQVHRFH